MAWYWSVLICIGYIIGPWLLFFAGILWYSLLKEGCGRTKIETLIFVILTVIFVALILGGAIFGYIKHVNSIKEPAYDKGYEEGFDDGYNCGHEDGMEDALIDILDNPEEYFDDWEQ